MKKLTQAQQSQFDNIRTFGSAICVVSSPVTKKLVAAGLIEQKSPSEDGVEAPFSAVSPVPALRKLMSHGGVCGDDHGTFLLAWGYVNRVESLTDQGMKAIRRQVILPDVTNENVTLGDLGVAIDDALSSLDTAISAMGFEGQRVEAKRAIHTLKHVFSAFQAKVRK